MKLSLAAAALHPLLHVWLSIVFNAASQVLLRIGASETAHGGWIGIDALASGWIWSGILLQILSLASWLHALRTVKLLIAFNLSGLLHAIVPLASWIFLDEHISFERWLGIALVLAGVFVVAQPVAKVEEHL